MGAIGQAPSSSFNGGLPTPQWEYLGQDFNTLDDGYNFFGDKYGIKVPHVDQSLIDNGQLFIQFGRLNDKSTRRDQLTGNVRKDGGSIDFRSPYGAGTPLPGSGLAGGTHNNRNKKAPNILQVIHQGFVSDPVPYDAFYAMISVDYFTGDPGSPIKSALMVRMKGTSVRKMHDPSNYVLGGPRYDKRPALMRDQVKSQGEFVARLVIVKDNKIIQFGPLSLIAHITWTGNSLYWNERLRVREERGTPLQAHITIGEKYKE